MRSIAERRRAVNLGRALRVLGLVLGLVPAPAARAHPEYGAAVINRYLKVSLLSSQQLRLAYTVMVGAVPAALARREADLDRDGRLDGGEAGALGQRWREQVERGLRLTLDGKPVRLSFEDPVVGLAGPEVAPSPYSIDLVARLQAPGPGPHALRLDDRTPVAHEGETELRIEEGPSTHLLAAHRGATGTERQTRFLFRGPRFSALEDRSITVRYEGSAPDPASSVGAPSRSGQLIRLLLAVLAILAILGVAWKVRPSARP